MGWFTTLYSTTCVTPASKQAFPEYDISSLLTLVKLEVTYEQHNYLGILMQAKQSHITFWAKELNDNDNDNDIDDDDDVTV